MHLMKKIASLYLWQMYQNILVIISTVSIRLFSKKRPKHCWLIFFPFSKRPPSLFKFIILDFVLPYSNEWKMLFCAGPLAKIGETLVDIPRFNCPVEYNVAYSFCSHTRSSCKCLGNLFICYFIKIILYLQR